MTHRRRFFLRRFPLRRVRFPLRRLQRLWAERMLSKRLKAELNQSVAPAGAVVAPNKPESGTFELFSKLPAELRLVIWTWALIGEAGDRLVFLEKNSLRIIQPGHLVSPLLSVSRESRGQAMAFYEVRLEVCQLPEWVFNPFHSFLGGHGRLTQDAVDEALTVQRSPQPVLGAFYISAVRDVFLRISLYYPDGQYIGLSKCDRLASPPLPEGVHNGIRRLARVREEDPFDYHFTKDTRQNKKRRLASLKYRMLGDAQVGWQSQVLKGVRHHGVIWVDRSVRIWDTRRHFIPRARHDGKRGGARFLKVIRRRVESSDTSDWKLEVNGANGEARRIPTQTFALGPEDLEGLGINI